LLIDSSCFLRCLFFVGFRTLGSAFARSEVFVNLTLVYYLVGLVILEFVDEFAFLLTFVFEISYELFLVSLMFLALICFLLFASFLFFCMIFSSLLVFGFH